MTREMAQGKSHQIAITWHSIQFDINMNARLVIFKNKKIIRLAESNRGGVVRDGCGYGA